MILSECKVEGRFEVCSKRKSEIFVMRSNNLERIPMGSMVFLENKTAIGDLREKYL